MEQRTYTTRQIAAEIGVHVNTVRFYEQIGFITKPARRANGYRVYTQLHMEQCRLIRRAMRAEVIQNGLRQKAVQTVRLCAALDFEASLNAAKAYEQMLQAEMRSARAAVGAVESLLRRDGWDDGAPMKRREAAAALRVTPETLRTWERSGLLRISRRENGYRSYDAEDMKRLTIIRTLRCANYSLSAILRLMNGLDRSGTDSVGALLNTPDKREDIVSVCDRLIVSLQSAMEDAQTILQMIPQIKAVWETLQ